jgi:hypothetical protein
MLINDQKQYARAPFRDEAEIESVVQRFAEQLFGSAIIYLPQARIRTAGGRGTVPDAIVIDVESSEWYIVEAERSVHGTWEHIAPQVSRQLAAVVSPETLSGVLRLALEAVSSDAELKEAFRNLGVTELAIHGHIERILRRPPTIAIPIDGIPRDLQEWIVTLRTNVKLWVIEKFVSVFDDQDTLYLLPDENQPTLSTTQRAGSDLATVQTSSSQPFQELVNARPDLIGQTMTLEYGPRGGQRRTFSGTLRADGIEIDGRVYSLSYGAVHCMAQAGSTRRTANGWVMWRAPSGELLSQIYEQMRPAGVDAAPRAV